MMMRPEPSLFKEGKTPVDAQVWYIDGSSWGQASSWTTLAMQSTTDAICFNSGVGQSSQWAELYTA